MRGTLAVLVLAAGCTPDVFGPADEPTPVIHGEGGGDVTDVPDDTVPVEDEPALPSEYEYTGDTEVDAAPQPLDVVASALDAAVSSAFSYRADPVIQAYQDAMAASSRSCPSTTQVSLGETWEDDCVTAGGSEFDGDWVHYDYVGLSEMGLSWTGDEMWGEAVIGTSDGYRFDALGRIDSRVGVGTLSSGRAVKDFYSNIYGSFEWTGPGSEGTWLATGTTPHVSMLIHFYTEIDGILGTLDGTAFLDVEGFDAVSYGDVTFGDVDSGWDCAGEPAGSISIRGTDGYWYTLTFDSTTEDDDANPECDGCGTVSWQGEDLGTVCPDFAPWLDWTGSPW